MTARCRLRHPEPPLLRAAWLAGRGALDAPDPCPPPMPRRRLKSTLRYCTAPRRPTRLLPREPLLLQLRRKVRPFPHMIKGPAKGARPPSALLTPLRRPLPAQAPRSPQGRPLPRRPSEQVRPIPLYLKMGLKRGARPPQAHLTPARPLTPPRLPPLPPLPPSKSCLWQQSERFGPTPQQQKRGLKTGARPPNTHLTQHRPPRGRRPPMLPPCSSSTWASRARPTPARQAASSGRRRSGGSPQ